jgi:hypothetical protein
MARVVRWTPSSIAAGAASIARRRTLTGDVTSSSLCNQPDIKLAREDNNGNARLVVVAALGAGLRLGAGRRAALLALDNGLPEVGEALVRLGALAVPEGGADGRLDLDLRGRSCHCCGERACVSLPWFLRWYHIPSLVCISV